MAAARFLRTSKPLHLVPSSSSSSSSSSSARTLRCSNNLAGSNETNRKRVYGGESERKSSAVVAVKASAVAASQVGSSVEMNRGIDMVSLIPKVSEAAGFLIRIAVMKKYAWRFRVQMFIQRVIIDCRFFSFFGVAGSLLGSVLCFVEGCVMIIESYVGYLNALSLGSDQGHIVQLLIEAIDMFLVGTAMLIFGVGLYAMFVGSNNIKGKGSSFFGLFYMKTAPTWVAMETVSEAKSKIGHAVMLILQVGVLEKFKSIQVANGLDLACMAAAILFCSLSTFILSRLDIKR